MKIIFCVTAAEFFHDFVFEVFSVTKQLIMFQGSKIQTLKLGCSQDQNWLKVAKLSNSFLGFTLMSEEPVANSAALMFIANSQ